MLTAVGPWIAVLVVFGIVIFVHELGHFLAAKATGVYAPRFSIGFGPALWRRRWGETEYVLAAVPLGGYVRLASREDDTMAMIEGGQGEQPAAEPAPGEPRRRGDYDPKALAPFGPIPVPEHRLFESKRLPARLVIMLAGVTMNMVLGFVLLAGYSWSAGQLIIRTRVVGGVHDVAGATHLTAELAVGDTIRAVDGVPVATWNDVLARIDSATGPQLTVTTQRGTVTVPLGQPQGASREALATAIEPYLPAVIDAVLPGSPASRGKLQHGDSVVAVDGTPIRTWTELVDRIEAAPGRTLAFTVSRSGTLVQLAIRPDSAVQPDPLTGADHVVGKIGAQRRPIEDHVPISFGTAMSTGWRQTWWMAGAIVGAVRELVTGRLSVRQLGGPIAIGRASYTAAKQGWDSLVNLIAFLSVNLAVFNLLPIPILDGGQILMNVAESVKGSALSARTREFLLRFGLAMIALLFVIVMYNDITSWVKSLLGL